MSTAVMNDAYPRISVMKSLRIWRLPASWPMSTKVFEKSSKLRFNDSMLVNAATPMLSLILVRKD